MAPDHAGSRPQARALVEGLSEDGAAVGVVLDCSQVVVATPSFLDEVIKQVLVIRKAPVLIAISASPRSGDLLTRAAENREVVDRLQLEIGNKSTSP